MATAADAAAMTLNARIVPAADPAHAFATPPLRRVNAGPYTEGELIHSGEATAAKGSEANVAGATAYGFAPYRAKVRPYRA